EAIELSRELVQARIDGGKAVLDVRQVVLVLEIIAAGPDPLLDSGVDDDAVEPFGDRHARAACRSAGGLPCLRSKPPDVPANPRLHPHIRPAHEVRSPVARLEPALVKEESMIGAALCPSRRLLRVTVNTRLRTGARCGRANFFRT